jgi:hypothetical protein
MIRDTPRSHQSSNTKGKELWKRKVADSAKAHVSTLGDFFLMDDRPLAAMVFYFPPNKMDEDLDYYVGLAERMLGESGTQLARPDHRMRMRSRFQNLIGLFTQSGAQPRQRDRGDCYSRKCRLVE